MDKLWKQKWVEALRSGKYKQGRGALHPSSDTYCCLGVLCEIAGIDWNKIREDYKGPEVLPIDILHIVGLDNANPQITDKNHKVFRRAATWNDNPNVSFNDIADMIEHTL